MNTEELFERIKKNVIMGFSLCQHRCPVPEGTHTSTCNENQI